jgi:hypothetical protein
MPLASVNPASPVLGGSPTAFTHQFGQPTLLNATYTFTAHNGDRVDLTVGVLHVFATDDRRVNQIILELLGKKVWDDTTARSMYVIFFPPDARPADAVVRPNGTHRLYQSTLLANTFPIDTFVDATGRQLPAGTFDVLCNSHIEPSEDGTYGCALTIGEWSST